MAAWYNGNMVTDSELVFHEKDLGLSRGYAIFDYLLALEGIPVFLDDHLERFARSAAGMHLPLPYTQEKIRDIIRTLLEQHSNGMADIKMMLTGGETPYGQPMDKPAFFVKVGTYQPPAHLDGIRLMSVEHQRELPEIKHTNYLHAVWIQPQLRRHGADDALYMQNGVISELPRSSFFIVNKEGVLLTPDRSILPGITRKHVIALAQKMMPVSERQVTLDEAHHAAEIFVTSTTKGIMPVLAVDNKPIGNGTAGPLTQQIMALLTEYKALHRASFSW